ncbi:hypothetical protein [Clostridium sp. VAP23]|uniref:hypothetical protein n=1 Tax=Clostridium sp. VAP23 TaxID=2949981 RepID=UPI00207ADF3B|nr:hypothetical protein [Clostridium sp. VAP23]
MIFLFQAISAYSEDGKRIVTDLAVLKSYDKGNDALRDYENYHKADKQKEYYVYNTTHETLEIEERAWIGVRTNG